MGVGPQRAHWEPSTGLEKMQILGRGHGSWLESSTWVKTMLVLEGTLGQDGDYANLSGSSGSGGCELVH